jgi:hypothetical protein
MVEAKAGWGDTVIGIAGLSVSENHSTDTQSWYATKVIE